MAIAFAVHAFYASADRSGLAKIFTLQKINKIIDRMILFEGQNENKPRRNAFLRILGRCIPYLLILVASFLPFICYFQMGNNIPGGDDIRSHLTWAYDLAEGWKSGFFGITPSHTLMGNLGVGTYLMYAPLSHCLVALINVIFPFISINWAWKILTISTTFLMGSWMYMLGKRLCQNDICGLMLGLILVFAPYRINCILYRAAYPEAIALSFYPLLFLGVYEIGHKDYRPQAFLCCVFGIACLILCHPFTALVGILAAFVYLLCQYKGFLGIFKSKRALIYTISSVAILLCLISFYIFPMLHYLKSGIYNVSDAELMWTNVDYVIGSIGNTNRFSGFLRPEWIDDLVINEYRLKNLYNESSLSWGLDYLYFGLFGALAVFFLSFFIKKKKRLLGTLLAVTSSFLPLIFTRRPEMLVVVPLFAASLLLIGFSEKEDFDWSLAKREIVDEAKSPELYWAVTFLILGFLLLYCGFIWEILPKIFLNAQFAWRVWGLVLLLILILLGYLIRPFRQKLYVQGALAMVVVLSFLSCNGIVDKRFCVQSGQTGWGEPTLSLIQSTRKSGVQNEYTPRVFRDSSYKSEYSNSLYGEIRKELYTRSSITYQWGMEDYLEPVFLEGSGKATITSLNSPNATFDITVTSETSLVQFPQFFYDGYEMSLEGETSYIVKGQNVDGLLSFSLKQGSYQASLKWVGLTSYQVGVPLFFVGLTGSLALFAVPSCLDFYKKKKERKPASSEEAN